MTNLLEKARALESAHRKQPETPRAWAAKIQDGKATIEHAPEYLHDIIMDHLESAKMYVEATARHILKQKGKDAKLEAFNLVPEGMQDAVSKKVHELKTCQA